MMKRLIGSVVACALALGLLSATTVQGQDLTTLLSLFLQQLATGQIGFPLGTNAYGYIKAQSDGVFTLFNTAQTDFTRLQFGGTTSSFPSLRRNSISGTRIDAVLADASAFSNFGLASLFVGSSGNGILLISQAAPTVSSGFGASPSIVNHNGTAAFTVNVGTGGTATTGVIGLPTAATGWNCWVRDLTAAAAHVADRETRQVASTTTTASFENQIVSTGATVGAPWAASDILRVSCFAY